MRWQGNSLDHGIGPGWTAELSRQSDHANNLASYTTTYRLLESSWSVRGVTAALGWVGSIWVVTACMRCRRR